MSESTIISVEARERSGKGAARETRRKGLVPGVIYGNKQPSTTVALEPRRLWAEMNKAGFLTRLFTIEVNGQKELCLVRDVQRHPVNDLPLHVDFLRVSAESKVHVRVPVHFAHQDLSVGLKRGGVLNIVEHEVEIIAPAGSIPSELMVDLSGLDIGASIHATQLHLPEGVALASHHLEMTIAGIIAPSITAEEETTEAAPAAEGEATTEESATPTAD